MSQEKPKQEITVLGCVGSETWHKEVAKVLPKYVTPEVMLRVARSIAQDPRFALCTPQSFLLALIKCARAGLPPDGRLAHLIPFGKEVQAIFDWKGYVAAAARNNIMVTAKLVYAADRIEVQEDDGTGKTQVLHTMDITKPRGEVLAVYSRASTGLYVDYEFMTADEVEYVRQTFSRAKNSDAWLKSWGEMAKKTVIRRHSKRWDLAPEVASALNEDDDSMVATVSAPAKPIFQTKQMLEDVPQTGTWGVDEPPKMPQDESKGIQTPPDEPKPASDKPVSGAGALEDTRGALKKANVKEQELLEFCFEGGIVPELYRTLDGLHEDNPTALPELLNRWDKVVQSIKLIRARKGEK